MLLISVQPTHLIPQELTSIDFFANIEQDITNYNSQGQIIFTGDINARSGQKQDFINTVILVTLYQWINSYNVDALNVCRTRLIQDKCLTNLYGNSLSDVCISSGLRILNGRTIGDIMYATLVLRWTVICRCHTK